MQNKQLRGFTLIELMVVVVTIGILALIGIPRIKQSSQHSEASAVATDLRTLSEAVEFYGANIGSYPAKMTAATLPVAISEALPAHWKDGSYHWHYRKHGKHAFIYVYNLEFTPEQGVQLDAIIDDGNIATGSLQVAVNGAGLILLLKEI